MRTKTRIAGWLLLIFSLVVLTGCHRLVIPAMTRAEKIALRSFHGRYVTALGEGEGWSLKQSPGPELSDCEWFTQYNLANGKIALETCHGRFVTAPRRGTTRFDWEVWQESGLGDCGQFVRQKLGEDRVAFITCAGKYLTAGNDGPGWEPPLQWAIVAETSELKDWEIFTVLRQR
ncbi:MAG: hypothetical protein H8E35_01160 [Ardenticatenia bacterium]|nr:hypothetical protein [Ardenticatenia bacterium]